MGRGEPTGGRGKRSAQGQAIEPLHLAQDKRSVCGRGIYDVDPMVSWARDEMNPERVYVPVSKDAAGPVSICPDCLAGAALGAPLYQITVRRPEARLEDLKVRERVRVTFESAELVTEASEPSDALMESRTYEVRHPIGRFEVSGRVAAIDLRRGLVEVTIDAESDSLLPPTVVGQPVRIERI